MEIYETITESGDGEWYEWYRVDLVTVKTLQAFRFKTGAKERTTYKVRFRPGAYDGQLNVRAYNTDTERSEFIAKAFEHLTLKPSPIQEPRRAEYFLDEIVGSRLQAVILQEGDIRLHFQDIHADYHVFNLYLLPTLHIATGTINHTEWGYADTLRGFLGKTLTLTDEYADAGLIFDFEDGTMVSVNTDIDFEQPEIAEYAGPDPDNNYIWFRPDYRYP